MWWVLLDLNQRPLACEASALPAELSTHLGDPYENRTRDSAVKGRCLNLLTNGPDMVAAVGFEPTTLRV